MNLEAILMENAAMTDGRYEDYHVPSMEVRVDHFLDLFMLDEFRGDAVVVNSEDLHNRKSYHMDKDVPYAVVDPMDPRVRKAVVESCTHLGNTSVFFFPREPRALLERFYLLGYYDREYRRLNLEDISDVPFIAQSGIAHLRQYLRDSCRGPNTVGVSFTHDAQLFCELYVDRKDTI